jgi:hypothetical protein
MAKYPNGTGGTGIRPPPSLAPPACPVNAQGVLLRPLTHRPRAVGHSTLLPPRPHHPEASRPDESAT